uniref:Uncharacterized protein n=1 Tax=Panagrolaimus superbus TaxID=310955 RepID=A0A914YUV9_9BILA
MVNLISLSFNYLLLPKPNDDSFAADLRLFYQLALNNSEEQATDLESVLQKFFALDEPIIRRGHSAPLLTQFPRLPTTAPGFSNNSDNPLRVQSSTFKTAQQ